jgi:hypothetical protein
MRCPHCQVEINPNFIEYCIGLYENNLYYSLFYMKCPNPDCGKPIIRLGKSDRVIKLTRNLFSPSYELIYPIGSNRPPAPIEVDKTFADDYNEACLVLPYSPKASAALSRRCLQNIIRIKEEIKEKNLMLEIDKLISLNKIPSYISDNLQTIRGFGNIAAHGMEDKNSGEILDVEPNEAEFLLDVLELMFDFYFVQPAKAEKMKDSLNEKLSSAGKPTV